MKLEYWTKYEIKKNHINLALYNNYYMLIKDMSGFHGNIDTKNEHKQYYCTKCNLNFGSPKTMEKHNNSCQKRIQQIENTTYQCNSCCNIMRNKNHLKQHILDCHNFDPLPIQMPKPRENNELIYTENDSKKQQKIPYLVYTDFEALLKLSITI